MRLIDADALIAEYDRVHVGAPGGARKLMETAPTIEAASVVHSHWIVRDLDAEYKRRAICPRCGWIAVETHDGFIKLSDFNFCAHCGAKMDEKENEK